MANVICRVLKKRSSAGGMPTVLSVAFIAAMLAMAVLPMATPGGAAAQVRPVIEQETGNVSVPAATPTPEVVDLSEPAEPLAEVSTETAGDVVVDVIEEEIDESVTGPIAGEREEVVADETVNATGPRQVKPGVVVTINKTECPAAYNAADATFRDLMATCQAPMAGVQFAIGTKAGWEASGFTDGAGQLVFPRLPVWGYLIWETTPPGYGWPTVYCETFSSIYPNGSGLVEEEVWYGNMIGIGPLTQEHNEVVCHWFNVPIEDETADGSITVLTYTCPAGYNPSATGADPAADCSTPTDGVFFALISQWSPPLHDITGSAGPGTVTFGGLDAGSYVIREQVPTGTARIFVLDCEGKRFRAGNDLPIELTYGEEVVCAWYNVPAA